MNVLQWMQQDNPGHRSAGKYIAVNGWCDPWMGKLDDNKIYVKHLTWNKYSSQTLTEFAGSIQIPRYLLISL